MNKQNAITTDRLLTDAEAGNLLGICRVSVWRHVKDGVIPKPVKLGRSSRFPLSDILGVIEAAKLQRAA